MRAIIITLLLGAAAAGGFLLYTRSSPETPRMFQPKATPPPPPRQAEDCEARHADYVYVDDPRLELRFTLMPSRQEIEVAEVQGRQIGNLNFVVHATSFQQDYVFAPVKESVTGPMHDVAATYLRPAQGGARFQVSMFNSQMEYIPQLPRDHSQAPAYIYMPGALATLYQHRIDQPPGLFRFRSCEAPRQ